MSDLFDGLVELAGGAVGVVGEVVQAAAGGAGTLLEGAGRAVGAAAEVVSPVLSDVAERAANYTFGGFKDPLQVAGEETLNDILDFSETFEQDEQQRQVRKKGSHDPSHDVGDTGMVG